MITLPNLLQELQLFIDDGEQLLIYCQSECGYALSVKYSQVTSHLRDEHQIIESNRRGLTRHLNVIYPKGFRNPADVPPRDDEFDAYPQLRVYNGFSCLECTYRTINFSKLTKHISKNHLKGGQQATRTRIQDMYNHVYLQTWTQGMYWIVCRDGTTRRPVARRATDALVQSVQERKQKHQES
jgi:hypothetical protein